MAILDGHNVEADQIDSARHRFIGTWRPPAVPSYNEIEKLTGSTVQCPCGTNFGRDYHYMMRKHWQGGCFDEPQYVTIDP